MVWYPTLPFPTSPYPTLPNLGLVGIGVPSWEVGAPIQGLASASQPLLALEYEQNVQVCTVSGAFSLGLFGCLGPCAVHCSTRHDQA